VAQLPTSQSSQFWEQITRTLRRDQTLFAVEGFDQSLRMRSLHLAQLPQHWARKKYFQWISVADESLAWTKCFVSVAGISDLISDR
jgi:hypothetical protein